MRVLVIEDEVYLLRILKKRLKEEGYAVDTAADGESGWDFAVSVNYDCIVLDIMLPGKDGFTILKELRAKKVKTPVLILTAKDTTNNKVRGLDLGADDYLVKPFSFDEFLARLRALLRRQSKDKVNVLEIGDLKIDKNTRTVKRGGKIIELTYKEYAVLEYLLRNKNIVLKKSQIAENIWDYSFNYSSNIVEVYIRYLRRKIDIGFEKKLIHTIRGVGYVIREK
jgi:DNA-binding response OmpR family regulator